MILSTPWPARKVSLELNVNISLFLVHVIAGEGFPEVTQFMVMLEFTTVVRLPGEIVNEGLERGSVTTTVSR